MQDPRITLRQPPKPAPITDPRTLALKASLQPVKDHPHGRENMDAFIAAVVTNLQVLGAQHHGLQLDHRSLMRSAQPNQPQAPLKSSAA